MALDSRLFWHEFRSALPPKGGSMFFVVMALICAASFLWSASPEVKSGEWSGFIAMPIGLVCGMAVAAAMSVNPRNPATINKTLPTPFVTLIAGRLSAVFLVTVLLPWSMMTVAMAVKFPGGFLPTSAMLLVILWLCFWGFTFVGTLAGESKSEALRHAALTGVAGFGPMLLYAVARYYVGRDAWEQNHQEDAMLNILIMLVVFTVILPLLCVSAWRIPFRKIRFRWYGPAVLMIAPLILCVPTARMISSLGLRQRDVTPSVLASFPADEGGTVRAENFIATVSPVYFDGDRSLEMEMKLVSLNSPAYSNWRNLQAVLVSDESRKFVVLYSGSMSGRGAPLLNHNMSRFQLFGMHAKTAADLIRPRLLLISGDRFADSIMSGSTDKHHIPECFAFPPPSPAHPVSEEKSDALTSPVAPSSAE